ncbi:MAG: ImmA/IrrE family metallo-endopeptidase [Ruminococcaceae bacterium]|nr:ImmA/IrrE family metallo-endopeptidase [Oscillospiraceae bacterium]
MPTTDYISNKVEGIVKKYRTRDPFELCEDMGIGVRYRDLGEQLKGFFFYQSRIKTIVLNSRTDEMLHRALCAHELGHAVLHSELLTAMRSFHELELFDSAIPSEYEANLFAAELLISDEQLSELLESAGYSVFQAASILRVPIELLDFKFKSMKSRGYEIDPLYMANSDFLKYI